MMDYVVVFLQQKMIRKKKTIDRGIMFLQIK